MIKRIAIVNQTEGGRQLVPGSVQSSGLAVTPLPEIGAGKWTVTHIASGCRVMGPCAGPVRALEALRALEQLPVDWSEAKPVAAWLSDVQESIWSIYGRQEEELRSRQERDAR